MPYVKVMNTSIYVKKHTFILRKLSLLQPDALMKYFEIFMKYFTILEIHIFYSFSDKIDVMHKEILYG